MLRYKHSEAYRAIQYSPSINPQFVRGLKWGTFTIQLYTKVRSERASKGQGGNEYINVEFFRGSTKNSTKVFHVHFNQKTFTVFQEDKVIFQKLAEDIKPHITLCYTEHNKGKYGGCSIPHIHEKKAKQQKGDRLGKCQCGYPCIYGTDYCDRHQIP